jgi:outer membrane protein assembly factor BamA
VAAGLYRPDPTDTIKTPGYVSIYSDITTKLYFKVGIAGYHYFDDDTWKFEYDLSFLSNPTKFWGIGYDNGKNSANKTDYKKWQFQSKFAFMHNAGNNILYGPLVDICYVRACDIEGSTRLWNGQPLHSFNTGLGFSVAYDTRDNQLNAYTGCYLRISQMFYPRFIGNHNAFSSTEFTVNCYTPLRLGTLLATQLHGMLTYGNTPWGMMPKLGNNDTMRGYYEGRYLDKSLIDLTVELRQHIYKRHSAVAWIAAAEVFNRPNRWSFSKILPNCGVGYRWEFKQRVNVRFDIGFGKHQTGVIFSINEAF